MTKKTFSDALFCFVQNFTLKQADACNQYRTPWKLPFIPLYIFPSPFLASCGARCRDQPDDQTNFY